jgi:hypothetical protein
MTANHVAGAAGCVPRWQCMLKGEDDRAADEYDRRAAERNGRRAQFLLRTRLGLC